MFLGRRSQPKTHKSAHLMELVSPADLDGLTGIAALILGEGHRQVKSEIRGNACHNLALALRPAGVIGFDSIIPIGTT